MLGLYFIVVTKVEQQLLLNTAGKKELHGSNTCYIYECSCINQIKHFV